MSRYDRDREQPDDTRDLRTERTDRALTPDAPWSPARDLLDEAMMADLELPCTPERVLVLTRTHRGARVPLPVP
jgi:hypothetical protein